MAPGTGETGRGGGKRLAAPPMLPETPGSCPGTRAWASPWEKLEGGGREEEVPREGQRKRKQPGSMPCSLLQLTSATGTAEAGWSGELGSEEPEAYSLMSIKAKACAGPWVCLSSGHLGQRNGPLARVL